MWALMMPSFHFVQCSVCKVQWLPFRHQINCICKAVYINTHTQLTPNIASVFVHCSLWCCIEGASKSKYSMFLDSEVTKWSVLTTNYEYTINLDNLKCLEQKKIALWIIQFWIIWIFMYTPGPRVVKSQSSMIYNSCI